MSRDFFYENINVQIFTYFSLDGKLNQQNGLSNMKFDALLWLIFHKDKKGKYK